MQRGFKHKYKEIYVFMPRFLFIPLHIWILEIDKSEYIIEAEFILNLLWNSFLLFYIVLCHVNLLWLKKEKKFFFLASPQILYYMQYKFI